MKDGSPKIVLCNGAVLPNEIEKQNTEAPLRLEYRSITDFEPNVKLALPDFVRDVFYLPHRILDLLEIAAYIFSADRLISRGYRDALEYHSWSRSFHFVVKVRDFDFWNTHTVRQKLIEALCFMSGDRDCSFTFQPGHSTAPTSLFDSEEFKIEPEKNTNIVLFSGGLDSFAGIIEKLETSEEQLCLVSHLSGQPGTTRTQNQLFKALNRDYPNRVKHYKFRCSLNSPIRASEETQRVRTFLYTSIAYALAHALSLKTLFVYENGITSLNFPKRQDLMNARASRTTHPKTIALLQDLFTEIEETRVEIKTPFLWKTKTDLFHILADLGRNDLITSTVSCNKTFQNLEQATHCGGCSQCVDRRFAAYASGLDDIDESGIYALDFIQQQIDNNEVKTILVDYVRQARDFATWNIDHFYTEMLNELADTTDYIAGMNEDEAVENIWKLCRLHGSQVLEAMKRMREVCDNPFHELPQGSFLEMIYERPYLKEPILGLVSSICNRLSDAIPIAFQKNPPKDENDFNDKVSAILESDKDEFEREHPAISFALARAVPDHSLLEYGLLIESKYIRGSTSPGKVSEGIAADLTKYPNNNYKLFIVYDPHRSITNDRKFKRDFEKKGRCTICIIR